METVDRSNRQMKTLVNVAIAMANKVTRSAAAEFLYKRRCSLDVIARVLAKTLDPTKIRPNPSAPQSPNSNELHRPVQDVRSDFNTPGSP